MVALWGRVEDVSGEENLETHNITMTRREAVSKWLEEVVGPRAKRDMDTAALNKNKVSGLLADLSRGNVSGACRGLQEAGDHRSALLAAQAGGGGESGRLLSQQLERWTEVRADQSIDRDRLRLYSLIAGQWRKENIIIGIGMCTAQSSLERLITSNHPLIIPPVIFRIWLEL